MKYYNKNKGTISYIQRLSSRATKKPFTQRASSLVKLKYTLFPTKLN